MNKKAIAKFELASAMFVFGTISVFVKAIPLNSGVVAFDRSIVGMLFLLLVKLCTRKKLNISDIKRDFVMLALSGAFLGVNWILLFESYNFTSVAISTICYNCAPMLVVLVSPIFFRERLNFVKIICVAVAFVGVAFVSGIFEQGAVSVTGLLGIALGMAAAVFYAATIIMNKKLTSINPMDKAIVQFASSTVVMFIYCLFTTRSDELVFGTKTVILLITVGVIHTGLAYFVYFSSLPHVTSQNVAIFAYIDPVVAVVLSALVLKEQLSNSVIIGAVLVIASALISELYDNKQKNVSLQQ